MQIAGKSPKTKQKKGKLKHCICASDFIAEPETMVKIFQGLLKISFIIYPSKIYQIAYNS